VHLSVSNLFFDFHFRPEPNCQVTDDTCLSCETRDYDGRCVVRVRKLWNALASLLQVDMGRKHVLQQSYLVPGTDTRRIITEFCTVFCLWLYVISVQCLVYYCRL